MTAVTIMPDFDLPMHSASGFLLRYVCPRLSLEPVALYRELARRLPFELAAPQADVIIGAGHGEPNIYAGFNKAPILEVGKYDPKEVKGKVIYLVSCLNGQELGPDLVNNGAAAFIGSRDDFVWIVDDGVIMHPWDDEYAAPCLMPIMTGMNTLLDGKTCQESMDIELDMFEQNARQTDDDLMRHILLFNRDNAVLLGNGQARIRKRPSISLPFPPPPMILPVGA